MKNGSFASARIAANMQAGSPPPLVAQVPHVLSPLCVRWRTNEASLMVQYVMIISIRAVALPPSPPQFPDSTFERPHDHPV
jgi:hypothetical protein